MNEVLVNIIIVMVFLLGYALSYVLYARLVLVLLVALGYL
jgi:hypothetical protein